MKKDSRKQLVDRLGTDADKLRSVFRAAPIGVGLVINRVIKGVNERLCAMTGYTRTELMDQSARMLYPTDQEFTYVGIEKYRQINECGIGTVETHWQRKDGTIIDVLLSSTQFDPIDVSAGVVFTALDITERKKAEAQLKESEERYRVAIEHSSDGVAVAKEGVYVYVNQKFLDMFGYERPEEIAGKPISYTTHPDHHHMVNEYSLKRRLGEPAPTKYDFKGMKKDGTLIDIEASVAGITFLGERVSLMFLRDITDRKKAEEALHESQERFRIAERMAQIGHFEWDILKDHVTVSPSLSAIHGLEIHGLQGGLRRWLAMVHPEDAPELQKTIWKAFRERRTEAGFECRIVRPDGDVRHIQARAMATYNTAGSAIRVIGVMTDVTERKKAEEELLDSREALRSLADHLVSAREDEKAFIARELHDELGQTLTALYFNLRWLRKKLRKDQTRLAEQVETMATLTNEAVGTIKRIQGELRPSILDNLGLTEALEWQADNFKKHTNIAVDFHRTDAVTTDDKTEIAIFRIFQEALTNVARHSDATNVKVELVQGAGEVRLTVRDNGRGIEQHEMSKPGSFGLLGIRERVDALRGRLIITGDAGYGTQLDIRIPIRTPEIPA